MLTSHFFPAWFLGTFPDKRVILAGYQAEFASRWGRRARAVMAGVGKELFGLTISKESSAADRWEIEGHWGGMETAGVGGSLTGKGADLLIVDDPISNAADAASETMRESLWEWFRTTAYTRLEPGASAVVIQTRWHEDDLAGRLLEHSRDGGEQWELLNLPAIAETNDILGRAVGSALWPERYNEATLAVTKRFEGSRNWASMFQQRPTPDDGEVFKRSWFKYFTKDGDLVKGSDGSVREYGPLRKFAVCDLAVSKEESADYTVFEAWGVSKDNAAYLIDVQRERLMGPDIVPAMKAFLKRWNCATIGIEAVAFQRSIVQQAIREGIGAYPIERKKDRGDKVARAHAATPRMEAGMVYFLQDAPWLDMLESELLSFPRGKHDDQVDALSDALISIHRGAVNNAGGFVPRAEHGGGWISDAKVWTG
jgi:predicted phage terminase large subunit-like protein